MFLFISFPAAMTYWSAPEAFDFLSIDAQTAATTLNILKNSGDITMIPSLFDMFVGNKGGCLGETSVLALLLGFAYLLYKRIIFLFFML